MDRSKNSKTVRWAQESSLREVHVFSPDKDCSSMVGKKCQEQLQAKSSSISPSTTDDNNDLPPGFRPIIDVSRIPQIKWKCPPSVVLNSGWRMAAGEESTEKDNQKQRELKKLEAVYPRDSHIPADPFVSSDVENELGYDDSDTPLVPLESEEDVENELGYDDSDSTPLVPLESKEDIAISTVPPSNLGEADVATALATVMAIVKHNEEPGNSIIDANFILRLANDPKMLKELTDSNNNNPENASLTMPAPPQITATAQTSPPPSLKRGTKRAIPSGSERKSCSEQAWPSGGSVSSSQPRVVKKDVDYYRNQVTKNDSGKVNKQCKFYNTSKGCRNGSRCRFQHTSVWKM
ncbi:Zinc finger CCCH domain-containing protein 30 [Glycine max]|nr:hypothetical protein JHK86_030440 [Glycine max]KAH1223997.1 Zinc finger CCCH domain-containing protein 30 [Glycine max]